jgi:EAL domain-containing protein (putative c-di-GMP-specific phosphodiesterase class I)
MSGPFSAESGTGSKCEVMTEWVQEVDLRRALAESRIATCYQPIVRMTDRSVVGLEVLARLDHPSRGMLAPSLFIPPMEDAGLAWPLTRAVAGRAFADWGDGVLDRLELTLALNVSLDVLLSPDALTALDATRADHGIAAESIVLELTESRPLVELERLRAATSWLHGRGYGLAIDDVGPGVRDHSALLDLQFTSMKLDKELVQRATLDPEAGRFLAAALSAARLAGLAAVAEGVEDAETWQAMREAGPDQAQGYFIGHPMPAQDVRPWLEGWD